MAPAFGIEARPAPEPKPRGWSSARIGGYAVAGLWLALLGLLLAYLISVFSPDFMMRYGPRYLDGLWTTLLLVGISVTLGGLLSLPLALARLSGNAFLNGAALSYTTFFRGTPLIAQTFLVYYGLGALNDELKAIGLWWFFREAWYCALFAFTLHTAAYQAEILRGAIRTVPSGQREASKAMGLSRWTTFQKIILPQALIVALRPYGNEIVLMIKASAIVAVITVYDLMGQTRFVFSRSFDFQAYLWAALLYLAVVETLRRIWDVLEQRLTRHLKR
ncbi:ABC transporter permease [Notoacmeibacter ruber]|uniref:ABC transporter permease n=1 Tax=Notoacmeibacter ruber TaxID=2670375 RepID=A0A3L7JG55_9HYPH|nr:ABC transporter permease [Notoacmeibacter ruber]RLQ89480.1 ABC transporter permease [Notoacmeibacter ruber]